MKTRTLPLDPPSLFAIFLGLPLAAGCGSTPALCASGGCGGHGGGTSSTTTSAASSTGGTGGTGGAPTPLCRGTAVPPRDLPPDDDGRSLAVPCPQSSVRVSVIDAPIVRLRYQGSSALSARPSYAVLPQPAPATKPLIGSTSAAVLVCTADLLITVDRASCRVHAEDAAGAVLL